MRTSIEELLLDPENPRLPEELYGASQSALFDYLYNNGVLEEIADSMLENGFFQHEPLIVLPPQEDGNRVVVEGNRRLAALMLIHGHPAVGDRTLTVVPTQEQLGRLRSVPVFEVSDREEVRRFLGFRHISGLKPWKSEAKARYISAEVDAAVQLGADNPFLFVARRVGSNTQGVRNAYMAFAILRHARDECGADTLFVTNERFGVWLRCMNSSEIKEYIQFGSPRTYEEMTSALVSINCERLEEVLGDLSPRQGGSKPVLADSRDVTQYGAVLQNAQAHAILRKYNDLEIAKQIIVTQNLPNQVEGIKRRIDALRDEVQSSLEIASDDLVAVVEELLRSAKLLQGTVSALAK